MVNKASTYWALSILVLFLCLSVNFDFKHQTEHEPLNLNNLIKVEPRFLYRNGNTFHATVVGELKINIKLDNLEHDLTNYDVFIIQGLEYQTDTKISLHWTIAEQSFHQPIQLNTVSYTPINFETKDTSLIQDMHLLIIQDSAIGTKHSFQDEIKFQSLLLNQQPNLTGFKTNISRWSAFNPISFGSINSYTPQSVAAYQALIVRLTLWVLITLTVLRLLGLQKKHMLGVFFIAWLIMTCFYLNSRLIQHRQIKNSFSPEQKQLNLEDKAIFDLAQRIKTKLTDLSIHPGIEHKVALVGSANFTNLRLSHHLNQYNIGLNLNLQQLLDEAKNQETTYLIIDRSYFLCTLIEKDPNYLPKAALLFKDSEFCLVRSK